MMTPHEIMTLPVAPCSGDGAPRCQRCIPIVGDRAPYRLDLNTSPVMVVDAAQPALCRCPVCGEAAQTPAILAVAVLTDRLRADRIAADLAEMERIGAMSTEAPDALASTASVRDGSGYCGALLTPCRSQGLR